MSKRIEVGNFEEVKRRNYWWNDMYVCYTGLNSKPFKVDENNYQIKCICNAGGITVNKFKTVYINFNLRELNITEETFLSHFVLPNYIIEFYIYCDYAKKLNNLLYAYYYWNNNKFVPDKYGRYNIVFSKLDKLTPQTKEKIDTSNPIYFIN